MQRTLASVCLFLSGIAGLVYEICWIRRASLVFGSTSYSLSTVLAVFFLGLAAGSWIFGRVSIRASRPIVVFACLELALAVLALASLPLFDVVEGLYGRVLRSSGDSPAVLSLARIGLVGAILLPPTLLMGGTLPLFCRQWVQDERRLAGTVAFLYALNTAGAAIGCAAAGFVLIPELGVTWSVRIAAGLNVAAGLGALALRLPAPEAAPAPSPAEDGGVARGPVQDSGRGPTVVPVLFFLTGFVVLGLEVLWSRYLTLLVRNSVYTYTLTLTAVLTGIVIGSLLGPLFLDRRIPRGRLFGALQVALGVGVLATMMVPATTWRSFGDHLGIYFAVLVPPAVLSGLSFPLAVRMVTSQPSLAGLGVGRMAAFNTFGGIAGSLAIGFVALPELGLETSLLLLTATSIGVGCAAWWLLDEGSTALRVVATAAVVAAWVAIPAGCGTRIPADFLAEPDALLDHREGLEANLALVSKDEDVHLEIDRWWQGQARKSHQVMAAHVPMLLRTAPRRVLVVGVGVGQTSRRFLMYDIEQLDCVDIEPRIFDFVREHFDSDWMDDGRVDLIKADGRNHLAHTEVAYDIVSLELGQLFRPGVASFYTEEFYRDARSHMAEGGLLSQFVPLPFLTPDTLRTVVATFLEVFPESLLWYNTSELLLMGVNGERFELDPARLELLDREGPVRTDLRYAYWGGPAQWLNQREELLGGFLIGPAGLRALAGGAPILSDDRPVLEYATRGIDEAQANELPVIAVLAQHLTPIGELPGSPLSAEDVAAAERARDHNMGDLEAVVHIRRFQVAKSTHSTSDLRRMLEEALAANPSSLVANRLMGGILLIDGHGDEAEAYYRKALAIRPGDAVSSRGLAVILHGAGRAAEAVPHYRALLAARPEDAEGHNNFAAALAQTGRLEEAVQHFEEALRLRPDFDHVRENLEKTRDALAERQ